MISYEQARRDHEYLWSIGPAQDMTGAYVDQEDLAKLLRSPTKATARDSFRQLWDGLNAARGFGWDSNPWVVAVSFTVERRNIDVVAA